MTPESRTFSGIIGQLLSDIELPDLTSAYEKMINSQLEHDPNTPCLFCGKPSGKNAIVLDRDLGGPFCSEECLENRRIDIAMGG